MKYVVHLVDRETGESKLQSVVADSPQAAKAAVDGHGIVGQIVEVGPTPSSGPQLVSLDNVTLAKLETMIDARVKRRLRYTERVAWVIWVLLLIGAGLVFALLAFVMYGQANGGKLPWASGNPPPAATSN